MGHFDRALGRRRFLTALVAAPTLTVAARLGADALAPAAAGAVVPSPAQPADLTDFGDLMAAATAAETSLLVLQVTTDNRVVFQLPRAEVGQGVTTALAMIVAEELDARLSDVDTPLSDARSDMGLAQSTGGSTSVRSLWDPVRQVAAAARARLVTAAAQQWNVDANTLTTHDTAVWSPDGRSASYGSLSAAAAKVLVPAVSTAPKSTSAYTVVGQPTTRVDARDIVTGKARYALDQPVAGALPTVVARPPTINGTVVSYDASTAKTMPGVVAVTQIPTGIAVTAQTFGQAMDAKAALNITWGAGTIDSVSDSDIQGNLAAATPPLAPVLTPYVEGTFNFAFVSHAAMEVLTAVADVRSGSAEVWTATKSPTGAQSAVASAVGLSTNQVTLHVVRGGGSFGRRLFYEPAVEAAQVSKAIGRPVRLMWTRNDDMRHGRLRPRSYHRVRAGYALGNVTTYQHQMASVTVDFSGSDTGTLLANDGYASPTIGTAFFGISEACPYNFGVVTEALTEVTYKMHTGSWRSVYSALARTAEEIIVDELARAMGQDPVAFRLQFLKTDAERAVVSKVASAGNWGQAMAAGTAQGVGFHQEYRSRAACLVNIDCTTSTPRVTRAVLAVDVGRPVNPKGLQAQAMSGLMDGIATVLYAGNHLKNGAVVEGSYADFHYPRQATAPRQVDVYVLPATGSTPGGAGELCVPAAAAAVANAYARATGTKPRNFPINF
ncbi:xanthine dehydrogenase family protein molybdopterin-binding subunit [Gandjariella thermophila]|uniref:Isoquinoline 1-oxidoreductase subunit beta n=1 Tax=Gandjariella thermophila TaxID=1931992 RepID=A0A4D4IZB2_9PSEU|nr:molybdopterin cofactor-binding domain-containing protein [Gandjariella thermophila]GDY29591.1 isoquinoline 1-oxidoreductase subunit beta [Gandjariella thermophila]